MGLESEPSASMRIGRNQWAPIPTDSLDDKITSQMDLRLEHPEEQMAGLHAPRADGAATRSRQERLAVAQIPHNLQEYEGIRVTFLGYLEKGRLPVQIDIGFGDAITPDPVWTSYPTLLENPSPILLAYPRETVVAEKLEAMVKLGIANTRMKDFHDLKTLASLLSFSSHSLSEAIRRTFDRRKTPLPQEALPSALTAEFYKDATKQKQWEAFVSKNKLYIAPITLQEVTESIQAFVIPVLPSPASENVPDLKWEPGGPWQQV